MAIVIKNEPTIRAFAFRADDEDLATLKAEVKEAGGKIVPIEDDIINLTIDKTTMTLTKGFAVVIDGKGLWKILSVEELDSQYTDLSGENVMDVSDMNERLIALEEKVFGKKAAEKTAEKPTEKSDKAETEKVK